LAFCSFFAVFFNLDCFGALFDITGLSLTPPDMRHNIPDAEERRCIYLPASAYNPVDSKSGHCPPAAALSQFLPRC
jgi:hypothetical protein